MTETGEIISVVLKTLTIIGAVCCTIAMIKVIVILKHIKEIRGTCETIKFIIWGMGSGEMEEMDEILKYMMATMVIIILMTIIIAIDALYEVVKW
jgi:hypothetical protein